MIRHNTKKSQKVDSTNSQITSPLQSAYEMPDSYEKHCKIVLLNPDDYNSWNYLKNSLTDNNLKEQFKLTELAIQSNPKSYSSWFHRYFLFSLWKNEWFREHQLCNILLKIDSRNFHCWNYCLKNGFEIKGNLHNFTSMHYKPYIERNLFIDPSDEAVWNSFERRRDVKGIIREYKGYKEIIFKEYFKGEIRIGNESKLIDFPIKRYVNYSNCSDGNGSNISNRSTGNDSNRINGNDISYNNSSNISNRSNEKSNCLYLNDWEMTVREENLPRVVNEILHLDPLCIYALKHKLNYSTGKERREICIKLQEIDPIRKNYYEWLCINEYKTFTFI